MYELIDYRYGEYFNDYEIYFHNTENDCKLRFISVQSKLMEQYNKNAGYESYYRIDETHIKYTIHEVPDEDQVF